MGRYYSFMFTGINKYYNFLNIAVALTAFSVMFIPIPYVVFLIALEILGFQNYMEKRDNAGLRKHTGEKYLDATNLREKGYREDIIYQYVNHYDLGAQKQPSFKIEDLIEYKNAYVTVINRRDLSEDSINRRLSKTKELIDASTKTKRKKSTKKLEPIESLAEIPVETMRPEDLPLPPNFREEINKNSTQEESK